MLSRQVPRINDELMRAAPRLRISGPRADGVLGGTHRLIPDALRDELTSRRILPYLSQSTMRIAPDTSPGGMPAPFASANVLMIADKARARPPASKACKAESCQLSPRPQAWPSPHPPVAPRWVAASRLPAGAAPRGSPARLPPD